MKIKTVYKRADFSKAFDKEVNQLIEEGWILEGRWITDPRISALEPMLYAELKMLDKEDLEEEHLPGSPDEGGCRVLLEPDTAYMVEIKRGASTIDDFVNYVIPLGILAAEKYQSKIDAAISELWTEENQSLEEEEL